MTTMGLFFCAMLRLGRTYDGTVHPPNMNANCRDFQLAGAGTKGTDP